MENEKKGDTLIIKLVLGVIAGIIIGLVSNEQVISVILPIKFFLGELIFFVVPFIIIDNWFYCTCNNSIKIKC